jgi:hypothetical protein
MEKIKLTKREYRPGEVFETYLGQNEFTFDGNIYFVFRNGILRPMEENGFNEAYNIN